MFNKFNRRGFGVDFIDPINQIGNAYVQSGVLSGPHYSAQEVSFGQPKPSYLRATQNSNVLEIVTEQESPLVVCFALGLQDQAAGNSGQWRNLLRTIDAIQDGGGTLSLNATSYIAIVLDEEQSPYSISYRAIEDTGQSFYWQIEEPANKVNGDFWYDINANWLKEWDAGAGIWHERRYVLIGHVGVGDDGFIYSMKSWFPSKRLAELENTRYPGGQNPWIHYDGVSFLTDGLYCAQNFLQWQNDDVIVDAVSSNLTARTAVLESAAFPNFVNAKVQGKILVGASGGDPASVDDLSTLSALDVASAMQSKFTYDIAKSDESMRSGLAQSHENLSALISNDYRAEFDFFIAGRDQNLDYQIARLSSSGETQWTAEGRTRAPVCVDSEGYVIAGLYGSPLFTDSNAIVKFDPDTGDIVWTWGGSFSRNYSLSVDPFDDILFTYRNAQSKYKVAKLNKDGLFQWEYGEDDFPDWSSDANGRQDEVPFDRNGNVFVAPFYADPLEIHKISPNGDLLWTKRLHSGTRAYIKNLRVDYVTGDVLFSPREGTDIRVNGERPLVVRFDENGNVVWVLDNNDVNSATGDTLRGNGSEYILIEVSAKGSVAVMIGDGSEYDYPGVVVFDKNKNYLFGIIDRVARDDRADFYDLKFGPNELLAFEERYYDQSQSDYRRYSYLYDEFGSQLYRLNERINGIAFDKNGNIYTRGESVYDTNGTLLMDLSSEWRRWDYVVPETGSIVDYKF